MIINDAQTGINCLTRKYVKFSAWTTSTFDLLQLCCHPWYQFQSQKKTTWSETCKHRNFDSPSLRRSPLPPHTVISQCSIPNWHESCCCSYYSSFPLLPQHSTVQLAQPRSELSFEPGDSLVLINPLKLQPSGVHVPKAAHALSFAAKLLIICGVLCFGSYTGPHPEICRNGVQRTHPVLHTEMNLRMYPQKYNPPELIMTNHTQ